MGRRALIVVVDDGDAAGRSATLYEVDLETEEARGVRQALCEHARRVSGETEYLTDDDDAATVREWARQRNLPVSGRGRIPTEIWKQFYQERLESGGDTVADAVNQAAEDGGENVVHLGCRRTRDQDS